MKRWTAKLGDRSLFNKLGCRVYAHHAAIAPVSTPVQLAVEQALQRYAELGAGAFIEYHTARTGLRSKLERLIGAEPGTVALVANTSTGISDIALSVSWRSGERIVVFRGEFPANVTPWQQAAQIFGLVLIWHDARRFLNDQAGALEQLERDLQQGVRMVAVSAVQFQTGLLMPLDLIGELCERHGAELCVDGIQACGIVPMDVQKQHIHYLASGGHKWLMGMEGSGFLYVAPSSVQNLVPRVAGWLSHEEPEDFLLRGSGLLKYDKPLKRTAQVFETGTQSVLGFVALEAGLDLILDLEVPEILQHVLGYLNALEAELVARGFSSLRAGTVASQSGILALVPPPGVELGQLQRGLLARGIVCGMPDGTLRFSPHWPNAASEVAIIAEALDDLNLRR